MVQLTDFGNPFSFMIWTRLFGPMCHLLLSTVKCPDSQGSPLTPTSPSLGEQGDLLHPDSKHLRLFKTASSPEMHPDTQVCRTWQCVQKQCEQLLGAALFDTNHRCWLNIGWQSIWYLMQLWEQIFFRKTFLQMLGHTPSYSLMCCLYACLQFLMNYKV